MQALCQAVFWAFTLLILCTNPWGGYDFLIPILWVNEVRNRDLGSFPQITQLRQYLNPGSLTLELVTQLSSYYRDLDLIPGLGRSPGEGKGYPLQYSGLENSIECRVHGVPKSGTQLSDFHFHFQRYKIQWPSHHKEQRKQRWNRSEVVRKGAMEQVMFQLSFEEWIGVLWGGGKEEIHSMPWKW